MGTRITTQRWPSVERAIIAWLGRRAPIRSIRDSRGRVGRYRIGDAGKDRPMSIDTRHSAVLALHWQVNVIKPEGFFGSMLAEPVARSGVLARAAHFHGAAHAAGLPVLFTRFTVPDDGGQLVTNTAFMAAVAASADAFRPTGSGAALVPEMAAQAAPDRVFDNQKLSGLAGNDMCAGCSTTGSSTLFYRGRHQPDRRADGPARHRPRPDRLRGQRLRGRRGRGHAPGVAGQPAADHGGLPFRRSGVVSGPGCNQCASWTSTGYDRKPPEQGQRRAAHAAAAPARGAPVRPAKSAARESSAAATRSCPSTK